MERTPALARDALEPSIFVNVQATGSSVVVQGDQEAVLQPGGLVICDSTRPTHCSTTPVWQESSFGYPTPRGVAAQHDPKGVWVPLSPGHPLTSFTNDYLRRLAADPALLTCPNADLVGHPSIELVRAVIVTHLKADELAAKPLAATLQLRILEYARKHLNDPDLCAERIAVAHYISERHLYRVLAEGDISLADWIRTHRLKACRQALAETTTTTTIAAIARRHGFTDMSSFSRAFRAEYELSPANGATSAPAGDTHCMGKASMADD